MKGFSGNCSVFWGYFREQLQNAASLNHADIWIQLVGLFSKQILKCSTNSKSLSTAKTLEKYLLKTSLLRPLFLKRNCRLIGLKLRFYGLYKFHGVKSVQIRGYFWSVFSCIHSEYRKIRTRNNPVFGHLSRSAHKNASHRVFFFSYDTLLTFNCTRTVPGHSHFLGTFPKC